MRTLTTTLMLILCACGGDDPAPSATVLEASPSELDPARDDADDLTIRIAYRDGDADLGGGTAEIHDCRAEGLVTRLALPPIASEAAVKEGVPIEGELVLTVVDVGHVTADPQAPPVCADLGVSAPQPGSAVFCVLLVDQAGRSGPGDCTDPITIL